MNHQLFLSLFVGALCGLGLVVVTMLSERLALRLTLDVVLGGFLAVALYSILGIAAVLNLALVVVTFELVTAHLMGYFERRKKAENAYYEAAGALAGTLARLTRR